MTVENKCNQLIAISENEWWPVYTFSSDLKGKRIVSISSEKLIEIEKVRNEFDKIQEYLGKLYYENTK